MKGVDATDFAAMADTVAERTAAACAAGRPLFFIVHYEHEAIKLSFLAMLRKALDAHGIATQSFDPGHRPEHGVGRLYLLMAQSAGPRAVAVVEGLPRHAETNALDTAFLEYFNLHRDLIVKEHLRLILLLHGADAESFIAGAGDLWDFRHHTYWLEGQPQGRATTVWSLTDPANHMGGLPKPDQPELQKHLQQVRQLLEKTPSPEDKGKILFDLGDWLFRRHLYAQAAEIAREGLTLPLSVNTQLRGRLEFLLSHSLQELHHLSDALTHYRKALDIYEEINDQAGVGTTLNNIAAIYKTWGRYEEALKIFEESLTIRRKIGDREAEGISLNNIGSLYQVLGNYEKALKTLEESLAIFREIGDRAGESVSLNNISQIYDFWGRYNEALKTLVESLTISREVGDRSGEGAILNNIALIYNASGRREEALKTLEESLAIRRNIASQMGVSSTLNNIGSICHVLGRHERALKTLEESLAISREIGDRENELSILNNISQVYDTLGRYEEALKTLEQSLAISQEIGDHAGEAVTCWNLAHEYQRRGELDKAIDYARCTVAIDAETNHPDQEKDRAFLAELEQLRQRRKTDTPIGPNGVTTG